MKNKSTWYTVVFSFKAVANAPDLLKSPYQKKVFFPLYLAFPEIMFV